jgi:hypothetical protein
VFVRDNEAQSFLVRLKVFSCDAPPVQGIEWLVSVSVMQRVGPSSPSINRVEPMLHSEEARVRAYRIASAHQVLKHRTANRKGRRRRWSPLQRLLVKDVIDLGSIGLTWLRFWALESVHHVAATRTAF